MLSLQVDSCSIISSHFTVGFKVQHLVTSQHSSPDPLLTVCFNIIQAVIFLEMSTALAVRTKCSYFLVQQRIFETKPESFAYLRYWGSWVFSSSSSLFVLTRTGTHFHRKQNTVGVIHSDLYQTNRKRRNAFHGGPRTGYAQSIWAVRKLNKEQHSLSFESFVTHCDRSTLDLLFIYCLFQHVHRLPFQHV